MSHSYTAPDVARFRQQGDVTPNGVTYDWWLVNMNGAGFCLVREPHHTDAAIEEARTYIQKNHDGVGTVRVFNLL